MRLGRLLLGGAVLGSGLVGVSGVAARPALVRDPEVVRDRLVRAALQPVPLFPTQLPLRFRHSNATLRLRRRGGFSITWDRGSYHSGLRRGYILFSRRRYRALAEDFRIVRQYQGTKRRVRIGSRRAWLLCAHLCGYAWHEQHRTYSFYGIDYARIGRERGDMRALIRHLSQLQPAALGPAAARYRNCGADRADKLRCPSIALT